MGGQCHRKTSMPCTCTLCNPDRRARGRKSQRMNETAYRRQQERSTRFWAEAEGQQVHSHHKMNIPCSCTVGNLPPDTRLDTRWDGMLFHVRRPRFQSRMVGQYWIGTLRKLGTCTAHRKPAHHKPMHRTPPILYRVQGRSCRSGSPCKSRKLCTCRFHSGSLCSLDCNG